MSIRVDEVTKKYNDQFALKKVSFQISRGEIIGFIGPNGAGKSTLMKIICGILLQDSGTVFINNISNTDNSLEIKKILGYLPEHNPLYNDLFIKEYLFYVAGFYKLNKKAKKKRIDEIIELTGLTNELTKKIAQLSKGYKQRVGIAQALIHDPEILILDEPTSGLDPNQIIEIRNLISKLGKEKTVLLSTHIMQEVEAISNRVIIIDKGKIVASGKPSDLTNIDNIYQTIVIELDKEVDVEKFKQIKEIENIKYLKDNKWIVESNKKDDIRPILFQFAVNNNLTVLSMNKKTKRLEEIFHDMTSK